MKTQPEETRGKRRSIIADPGDPPHPDLVRHNLAALFTRSASNEITTQADAIDMLEEAQANLQFPLGLIRIELAFPDRELEKRIDYLRQAENGMAECLARLHTLLDHFGVTMMMPAQHPKVTGLCTDKETLA